MKQTAKDALVRSGFGCRNDTRKRVFEATCKSRSGAHEKAGIYAHSDEARSCSNVLTSKHFVCAENACRFSSAANGCDPRADRLLHFWVGSLTQEAHGCCQVGGANEDT